MVPVSEPAALPFCARAAPQSRQNNNAPIPVNLHMIK
jgi:hypothetical protein